MNGNIRLGEVRALRQQRFAGGFGEGVGKAVAEIQPCGVTAFAVLAPGRAGEVCEFGVDGNNLDLGADDKEIELPACATAFAALDHHASFEDGRGRDEAATGSDDGVAEDVALRLVKKDCRQGRGVNDRLRFASR